MEPEKTRKCPSCGHEITGRTDKKFCNVYCKSAFHYRKSKFDLAGFYLRVDKILKHNRKLLKVYNKSGKSVVRAETILNEGFNPNFFTHYWKNAKGDVYLFVYEYGFLKLTENGKDKYVLVTWQEYMNKHL
jgi:hypothetical protein